MNNDNHDSKEEVFCAVCKHSDKELKDYFNKDSFYKFGKCPENFVENIIVHAPFTKHIKFGEINLCIWCKGYVYNSLKEKDDSFNNVCEKLENVRDDEVLK